MRALPQGVIMGASTNGNKSFARYAGILIVFTLIGLAVAQFVAFVWADICNPLQDAAGKIIIHKGEVVETCQPRMEPAGMAAWSTAIGMTLGGTAGWFYRENKRAEKHS